MNSMQAKITHELNRLAQENNVRVLYACESGSRAWGFASPDSDYDVRFMYVHPEDWYLSVFDKRDVIDKPITDELDLGGWEIRKSLGLLLGSNAPLLEWLHSPVIYLQDAIFLAKMRELAQKCFRAKNVCFHYYVMAQKLWKRIEPEAGIKLKTLFYVLRALLCVEWIMKENCIPPVAMSDIVNKYYAGSEFSHAVDSLRELKSGVNEAQLIAYSEFADQLEVVNARVLELFAINPISFPENQNEIPHAEIDRALIEIVRNQVK
jgi:predicted nucleotidyltransferase